MSNTDIVISLITKLLAERDTFTSDDIRPLLPADISPRAIPPALGKARRDGLVEEVDRVRSMIPERKGSLVPVLRRPGSVLGAAVSAESHSQGSTEVKESLSGLASEIRELQHFLNVTGYVCGIEEIATYLLLLASHNWVILSGPSGTGKSSLVKRVASALDAQFHDVQVKPNWVSSEDSLGYYSEATSTFLPGPVADALTEASENPESMHFVRFDEMNLASPEYYLAEILSAGESWSVDEDGISRSDRVQLPPMPQGAPRPTVRITGNTFLIGTVNVDETTRSLSAKVLDRSAVLDLRHVDLFSISSQAVGDQIVSQPTLDAVRDMLAHRPRSISSAGPSQEEVDLVAEVLDNLRGPSEVLSGPIGYRQRDALVKMLTIAKRTQLTDVLPPDSVIDIGLRSCVLPKWQGSTPAARRALTDALAVLLDRDVNRDQNNDSLRSFGAASRFPRTVEKIVDMADQFDSLGYFSAW